MESEKSEKSNYGFQTNSQIGKASNSSFGLTIPKNKFVKSFAICYKPFKYSFHYAVLTRVLQF